MIRIKTTLALTLVAILAIAVTRGHSGQNSQIEQQTDSQARSEAKRKQREQENQLGPITPTQIFMRDKLRISNQILRGLSTDEFDDVISGADRLTKMSKRSHWQRAGNPVYAQDTADFLDNIRLLRGMAEDKNQAGATLAFSQLMVRCSDCHNHVRSPKVAVLGGGGIDEVVASETATRELTTMMAFANTEWF
ncbi:MAG: hypothetical protein AB8G99_16720 [Planctomycetaceae bacterium]